MEIVATPNKPGTYALLIQVSTSIEVTPGRLGTFRLNPGWYVYIGSARGPGGLAARIARHLRAPDAKRPHWHIDYLLAQARVSDLVWAVGHRRMECTWAHRLLATPDTRVPIPRFGASDCTCPTHLIQFSDANQATRALASLVSPSSPHTDP